AVTHARADAIDEPAGEQESDRVGEGERCADDAVVLLAPAEFGRQRRGEYAEHRTIDVVDRGGEEQQGADDPAVVARPGDCRRWRGGDVCTHARHVPLIGAAQMAAVPLPACVISLSPGATDSW